jgi:hopanoid biosynthesis associated radical SAM protein HpnH
MSVVIPFRQGMRVVTYVLRQRLAGRDKFPIAVELEPLYACNLACAGCGKIQHPASILKKRMSVDQAVSGIMDSGAPIVCVAGGEPLIHPEIHEISRELVKRRRYVFMCTNGLLMRKKMDLFEPSPYFAWTVHIDGLRERHDESVCKTGVFDECVEAIKEAKRRGFRVTTNSTFFTHDKPESVRAVLDYLNDELEVDGMMISPAYAYEKAPDQDHFPGVEQAHRLFRQVFADGGRKRWRLNHTPLFLKFLQGKADFGCSAWAIPGFSVLGWQRPCYLMADGHVSSYKELIETTDWEAYGRGRDARCSNCMASVGYESTSVFISLGSLRGPLRSGSGGRKAAVGSTDRAGMGLATAGVAAGPDTEPDPGEGAK